MKKMLAMIVVAFTMMLVGCGECEEPENRIVYINEYDVPGFQIGAIGRFYSTYSIYYGGVYVGDHGYVVCVRDDAPEAALLLLDDPVVEIQMVSWSYSELIGVHSFLSSQMHNFDLIGVGLGIRENQVMVDVLIGWDVPVAMEYYVEVGIVHLTYLESPPVFTY